MLKKIDLKYRFGFLIAGHKDQIDVSSSDSLSRWNAIRCGDGLVLHHYETKFTKYQFQNYLVFTLGDVFCAHGDLSLEEILRLFSEENNWDVIDNLSGRFAILIYSKVKNCFEKILTDPIASRSLFYSTNVLGVVASHSALLAEIFKIKRDESAVEFVKSEDFLTIKTKFLPADLTMYKGIYGMPANHYYSFEEQKLVRFWPRKPIECSKLEDLLTMSKEYLLKQVEYFSAIGAKPIIGLTGGVDCRSLISVWNSEKIHFKCLTWNRNLSKDELAVIGKISSHIFADSYFLDTKKTEESSSFEALKSFGRINRGNFMGTATLTAQTAEFVSPSDIFVRGLGGEILRGMFNKSSNREHELDNFSYAVSLYKTGRLKNPSAKFTSFVSDAYQGFFSRINLSDQEFFNYDFGDFIYWEQRMSMWASSLLNEADPALKNIAGLNSRKMYELAYGLSPEVRFRRELLLDIACVFDSYLSDLSVV